MWGNSWTRFIVANMMAEAADQRAAVRTPGVIVKDSTPLNIPVNRFAGVKPALTISLSRVDGTK